METKHTPGDWEIFDNLIRVKRNSFNLSHPHAVIAILNDRGVETRANGLVLAAAPELLEVCQVIIEEQRYFEEHTQQTGMMPGNQFYSDKFMKVVNMAKAALAKAKGES